MILPAVPAALPEHFKQAMRRLAATVSIVTCTDREQWFGLTATAVTSLCAEPASIIVCINSASSVLPALTAAQRFCVNLLTTEQQAISSSFGGRLKGAERFNEGIWQAGEDGTPFLPDAQANLFCELDKSFAYGTHVIVVGRVTQVNFTEAVSPLIYQNGSYVGTAPLAAGL